MATVNINASIGTNPLVPAGTVQPAAGTNTYNLYGLHSLGEGMTQPGIIFVVNISAYTSGNLTVTAAILTSSGYTSNILSSTALAATGTIALQIGAGLPATANASANALLPNQLAITVTPATTPVFTYGIDYCIAV